MKVKITDPAKAELKKIYDYHRRRGNGKKGRRVRREVMEAALILKQQPFMGQKEENLEYLGLGHRYVLVSPHYKVIYRIEGQVIYVTDVFDTRQDLVHEYLNKYPLMLVLLNLLFVRKNSRSSGYARFFFLD
ncbi:MAG: type II toxin-antitoxin system RelE/ParE family toxin [Phaeodactylibacter sp.]|nr:type II toxin-antitoxin system RelE/ParE family toxin [Phaeodactylibacter sp.]